MIDSLALGLSHGLLLLAAWRLLFRPDLDDPDAPASAETTKRGWASKETPDA